MTRWIFSSFFRSVAGVLPELGVGASDYACANAFLIPSRPGSIQGAGHSTAHMGWPSWKEIGVGEVQELKVSGDGPVGHQDKRGDLSFGGGMGPKRARQASCPR